MEPYFEANYAKLGTSSCKKCKQKLEKGFLRLAKVVSNPFSGDGSGEMKNYHHPKCLFDSFVRARATTKIILEPDDIRGFDDLEDEDQQLISELIDEILEKKQNKSPGKKASTSKKASTPKKAAGNGKASPSKAKPRSAAAADDDWEDDDDDDDDDRKKKGAGGRAEAGEDSDAAEKDNSFREYRKLCAAIAGEASYTGKTNILKRYLEKGSTGRGFDGDVYLLLKLLLPNVIKAVYNLQDKQIVKCFSSVFETDLEEMVEDLDKGDVAETVALFFEESAGVKPQKKSTLSLQEVNSLLDEQSDYTKEEDQISGLTKIAKRCTGNDLKMIVRLIKHDLRINAGARHVLDALDPKAYESFQASRDLRAVVNKVTKKNDSPKGGLKKDLSVRAQLMTPIQPMLAEACRSVDQAFKKCPQGMYAEIKYDGERVQLHKQGTTFRYFSRSLKPVQPHKVQELQAYIPKAFPGGNDLILDCEVLMMDRTTGNPLPFGTLGKHKQKGFKEANVCLFVFDCLHFNNESLLEKPLRSRRKTLEEHMEEIEHRILFSEQIHITDKDTLTDKLSEVFSKGLEGVVLKDPKGVYEPGKRHWLKVKKDYLAEGTMADSADLVVLGAYYGTGNKGGIMSVFLMGCYNPKTLRWCTVTKCGNGFDDRTLKKLQTQLNCTKISKDFSQVPPWLNVHKSLVPDFVVDDPKKSQVWEITGAEFSKSEVHTADGISIRFPRLTKIRDDKSVGQATNLPRLIKLFASSKERSDIPNLLKKGGKATKGKSSKRGGNKDEDEKDGSDTEADMLIDDDDDDDIGLRKNSPTKRKADNSMGNDVSPAKKSKNEVTTGLPACKYGAACYQKNPEHHRQFSHPPVTAASPSKPPVQATAKNSAASGPLVNIFSDCKFYVPATLVDCEKLKRYIISYDGDVLGELEKKNATHIVVSNTTEASKDSSVRKVTSEWIWRCIKQKKLLSSN